MQRSNGWRECRQSVHGWFAATLRCQLAFFQALDHGEASASTTVAGGGRAVAQAPTAVVREDDAMAGVLVKVSALLLARALDPSRMATDHGRRMWPGDSGREDGGGAGGGDGGRAGR